MEVIILPSQAWVEEEDLNPTRKPQGCTWRFFPRAGWEMEETESRQGVRMAPEDITTVSALMVTGLPFLRMQLRPVALLLVRRILVTVQCGRQRAPDFSAAARVVMGEDCLVRVLHPYMQEEPQVVWGSERVFWGMLKEW
jgi:hypothetical protein